MSRIRWATIGGLRTTWWYLAATMVMLAVMAAGAHTISIASPAMAEPDRASRDAEAAAERAVVPSPAAGETVPVPTLIGGIVLAFAVGLSAGHVQRRRRLARRRDALMPPAPDPPLSVRPAPATLNIAPAPAPPAPPPPEPPKIIAPPPPPPAPPPPEPTPAPPLPFKDEPEPVAEAPEPEPEAVAEAEPPAPEPEPVAEETQPEPSAPEPEPAAEPEPEASTPAAEPEPVVEAPAPEPVAEAPEPEAEPPAPEPTADPSVLGGAPEVPRTGDRRAPWPEPDLPIGHAPESIGRAAQVRRFARRPWPLEADTLWTCEITWKAGYVKSTFRAMAGPPGEGRRRALGESLPLRWTLMTDPEPPTPEMLVNVRALVRALEAAGWERTEPGGAWFAQRFLWRGVGEPGPVEVPEPSESAEPPSR